MFETLVHLVARFTTGMWVVGLAGCILALPIMFVKLFAVLFQKDNEDEIAPASPHG